VPAIRESVFAIPYAVASRTLEKAQAFASEHGFGKTYGIYEELFQDLEVDVIYNPLPNSLHCEWTIRCLNAGKHVLCEKPLASNVGECKENIAAAKRNRPPFKETFMVRFHPSAPKYQELLAEQAIGPVRGVRAAFGFLNNQEAPNVRLAEDLTGGC